MPDKGIKSVSYREYLLPTVTQMVLFNQGSVVPRFSQCLSNGRFTLLNTGFLILIRHGFQCTQQLVFGPTGILTSQQTIS